MCAPSPCRRLAHARASAGAAGAGGLRACERRRGRRRRRRRRAIRRRAARPARVRLTARHAAPPARPAQVNKLLVEFFKFKFVMLLTSLHFFTGFLFLSNPRSTSESCRLLARIWEAPWRPILQLSIAGAGSIALLNYSLRFNSVGTYQIMKVAILPVTMALSFVQNISKPSPAEVGAAALVIAGTLVCTMSDVTVQLFGVVLGVAGVVHGAVPDLAGRGAEGPRAVQHAGAVPHVAAAGRVRARRVAAAANWATAYGNAALMGLVGAGGPAVDAAMAAEGVANGAPGDDIWHHAYSMRELGALLATCAFAVGLNYSTMATMGARPRSRCSS